MKYCPAFWLGGSPLATTLSGCPSSHLPFSVVGRQCWGHQRMADGSPVCSRRSELGWAFMEFGPCVWIWTGPAGSVPTVTVGTQRGDTEFWASDNEFLSHVFPWITPQYLGSSAGVLFRATPHHSSVEAVSSLCRGVLRWKWKFCSGFVLVLSLNATCMLWLSNGPLGFLQGFLLLINEYFTAF